MMRVAALYDIHGNLPALEAVLADPRLAEVEAIVCGGDLVAGPMPSECLERLEALGERVCFVRGNGDREVAAARGSTGRGMFRWCATRLGRARLERVEQWPLALTLEIGELGPALFCHATPSSDTTIVTAITPAEEAVRAFAEVGARVVVCGHVHVRYDRWLTPALRLVNPGSVGAPYEGAAGAYWALLGPDVELCRTPYDVDAAAARIAATGCPDIAWMTESALREPLSAEDANAEFESRRGA